MKARKSYDSTCIWPYGRGLIAFSGPQLGAYAQSKAVSSCAAKVRLASPVAVRAAGLPLASALADAAAIAIGVAPCRRRGNVPRSTPNDPSHIQLTLSVKMFG